MSIKGIAHLHTGIYTNLEIATLACLNPKEKQKLSDYPHVRRRAQQSAFKRQPGT